MLRSNAAAITGTSQAGKGRASLNSGLCFLYWDNSNILHEAQRLVESKDEGPDARWRVRMHLDNLLSLAHAQRPVKRAFLSGQIPAELRRLGNRMETEGIEVGSLPCHASLQSRQTSALWSMQIKMLEDALDYCDEPGIAVILCGDEIGYHTDTGLHRTLMRILKKGWQIELLCWARACSPRVRQWVDEHGVFVALDDYFAAITYMEPSRPGFEFAPPRYAADLNLDRRPLS